MTQNQKIKNNSKDKIKSAPRFYMVIEGERGLKCCLEGAVGVREFSENKIGILMKNGSVNIEGNLLSILLYDNNCLEISGNIENISVIYKNKRSSFFNED